MIHVLLGAQSVCVAADMMSSWQRGNLARPLKCSEIWSKKLPARKAFSSIACAASHLPGHLYRVTSASPARSREFLFCFIFLLVVMLLSRLCAPSPTDVSQVIHSSSISCLSRRCPSRTYRSTVCRDELRASHVSNSSILYRSVFGGGSQPRGRGPAGRPDSHSVCCFLSSSCVVSSAGFSIQQRNGRKTLTTIQGIDEKFDQVKLVKVFKKVR